jgi:hypothetical protein
MDFRAAERHFKRLQKQKQKNRITETEFRVDVAKLTRRDHEGVLWMLDPEGGAWFCNSGDGWEPGDPHVPDQVKDAMPARGKEQVYSRRRIWAGVGLVAALAVVAAFMAFLGWPPALWNQLRDTTTPTSGVAVSIAAPANGDVVPHGQLVAVEATIRGVPDLTSVKAVELRADQVAAETVNVRTSSGQASLPITFGWRPVSGGERELAVVALSAAGDLLARSAVVVEVAEARSEPLVAKVCEPGVTFLSDVTLPAGTVLAPGARVEKVWKVLNSGSCAWGLGYELVRLNGSGIIAPAASPLPPTEPGEETSLAVIAWAPEVTGTHTANWRFRSPSGEEFGPVLQMVVKVESSMAEMSVPAAPMDLVATVIAEGQAVQVSWIDRADNEDAFRIYRDDLREPVGFTEPNAESFVDFNVACDRTYLYRVVALNGSGASSDPPSASVAMSPCTSIEARPTLSLTILPAEVHVSETFTVSYVATGDLRLDLVAIWGEDTGHPALDEGALFSCTWTLCTGDWPLVWNTETSATVPVLGVARDRNGRESDQAGTLLVVRPALTGTVSGP